MAAEAMHTVDRLLWHSVELRVELDLPEPISPERAAWLAAPTRITPRKGGVALMIGQVRMVFGTSADALAYLAELIRNRRLLAEQAGMQTATGLYHHDCAAKYLALRDALQVRAPRLWPGEVGI